MTTQINQLTELTTTSDGDLLLIRESATGVDKKIQSQNLRAKATTKDDVGLGNVDNVSAADLRDRSTHTGTQTLSTISDAGTMAAEDKSNVTGDVNFDSGTLFVDASTNNVGIGTTSPNAYANYSTLTLNNSTGSEIDFESNGTLVGNIFGVSSSFVIGSRNSLPFRFLIDNSEAMRIDSSGNVLIGTTATVSSSNSGVNIFNAPSDYSQVFIGNTRTTSIDVMRFFNGNGEVGSITTNASATAYNTSSDYRLKENAQPITGALAKVQAMNPVRYNWKADGSEGEGFIAHELQEIVPYAVSGQKDGEEMQGVDYGKLTTLLTAAIKELKAELDELKGAQ